MPAARSVVVAGRNPGGCSRDHSARRHNRCPAELCARDHRTMPAGGSVKTTPVSTLLVTGATGFVGSHVIEASEKFGIQVRALVRKPADAKRLRETGIECVQGSLEDEAALREAMSGMSAVLHLAAA